MKSLCKRLLLLINVPTLIVHHFLPLCDISDNLKLLKATQELLTSLFILYYPFWDFHSPISE